MDYTEFFKTNTTPIGLLDQDKQDWFKENFIRKNWEWFAPNYWKKTTNSYQIYLAYRITKTGPSIDWNAVDDKFNWLVVNEGSFTRTGFLFQFKPVFAINQWLGWRSCKNSVSGMTNKTLGGDYVFASGFKSLVLGDLPAEESIVERPGRKVHD